MKKFGKLIVGVLTAVLLLSTTAFAADTTTVKATNAPVAIETVKAPAAEAWTFSLSGAGATTTKGDSQTLVGGDISLGHTGHILLPVEFGVRQGFAYASGNGGATLFSTRPYLDWTLFTLKKFDIYAGGSVGAIYGNTSMRWVAAPEVGLHYWIKSDVGLFGRIEYPFNLNDGKANDTLNYAFGLVLKF